MLFKLCHFTWVINCKLDMSGLYQLPSFSFPSLSFSFSFSFFFAFSFSFSFPFSFSPSFSSFLSFSFLFLFLLLFLFSSVHFLFPCPSPLFLPFFSFLSLFVPPALLPVFSFLPFPFLPFFFFRLLLFPLPSIWKAHIPGALKVSNRVLLLLVSYQAMDRSRSPQRATSYAAGARPLVNFPVWMRPTTPTNPPRGQGLQPGQFKPVDPRSSRFPTFSGYTTEPGITPHPTRTTWKFSTKL